MMFLERNLEQLTVVQRQLVEQNSSLKKEVAIAERKLIARNERIQSLESLLQDSQEKLTAANHRYIQPSHLLPYKTNANTTQIRSSTHSRQRTSRICQARVC
jgi:kinesin family protein 5